MEHCPMELLTIEFKGNKFRGEIAPTMRKAEENGTIFLQTNELISDSHRR